MVEKEILRNKKTFNERTRALVKDGWRKCGEFVYRKYDHNQGELLIRLVQGWKRMDEKW